MEQTRLLLAIGLSFLVLFVWSIFFVDQQPVVTDAPEKEPAPATAVKDDPSRATQAPDTATVTEPAPAGAATTAAAPGDPAREITVETPFYEVRISTNGASFTSFILKKFRETVEADSPNKQLIPETFNKGVLRTSLTGQSLPGLDNALFSLDQSADHLEVSGEKKSLAFTWEADNGTRLVKTYTFDPDSYLIDLSVAIENASQRVLADQLVLSIRKPLVSDSGYGFVGPSALIDDRLEQVKPKKIEDKPTLIGNIKWISIEDRYFLSSVIPGEPVNGSVKLALNADVIVNQLVNPTFEINPGTRQAFQFYVFMGPKSMELLNSLGHDLGKALNFGFFNFIAKPCLWFMNQIYSVIPNYGIAIIILTIITKLILWPLGNKSYKSMSEMKKLQPLMTEIREKHKGDKQKMNQELMALYRTYKVNPMGGCLPMVLQIPVFFALYRMLYQAIELRHAPFFLWINDLSAPDRLFDFGFSIPFMEPPYGIPVLTIIMGATMLLQQKMSPPPGDPTQAKMMMLMPVVFTFIFINFSSGLVLYWLVNNVLSISQQYYVQKKT